MFSAQTIADYLTGFGIFSIAASIFVSILIAVAGVIPSIFVTGANVILFGPFYGLLISWLGETIGAGISFYLYRFGFKKKTEYFSQKYRLLKKITCAHGFKAGVLIFQARLVPFIPSGFVTLAGSVSNVDIVTFISSTAVGKLPSIALEVLISYDVINISKNWLNLAVTVAVLILLSLLYRNGFFGDRDS